MVGPHGNGTPLGDVFSVDEIVDGPTHSVKSSYPIIHMLLGTTIW